MDIPISAGKLIADKYDYDQVIIIARKVGRNEHVTTYGVNEVHCGVAARMGKFIKYEVMKWENAIDKPKWIDGKPANIRAAAADAIEWLKIIKPESTENRRRLNACMADLLKWTRDA